jgi:hypothetical protein
MFDRECPGCHSSGVREERLDVLAGNAERLLSLVDTILSAVGWRSAGVIGSMLAVVAVLFIFLTAGVHRLRKVRRMGVDPCSEKSNDDKK